MGIEPGTRAEGQSGWPQDIGSKSRLTAGAPISGAPGGRIAAKWMLPRSSAVALVTGESSLVARRSEFVSMVGFSVGHRNISI